MVARTTPFGRDPSWRHLLSLKPGESAGNWRDSDDGLGGGRYPYDVNGAWAPAALRATARLLASGMLAPVSRRRAHQALGDASAMSVVWEREGGATLRRRVPVTGRAQRGAIICEDDRRRRDFGDRRTGHERTAFSRRRPRRAQGQPVPILNSDEAFALLLLDPAPADVERIARTLTRPFPAGLLTGAGLLVANPVYAPDALEPAFGRNRYHGTVVWSWQQALLAAGLQRQLERDDLTPSARAALEQAQTLLGKAAAAGSARRGAELWSWSEARGVYRVESFGQRQEDETEANAAQLWSTVYLAQPHGESQPGDPRSAFYSDRVRVHHGSH